MSEVTVGTRYAKSLIDLAQEQNIVDAVKADMDLFIHTLKANPELKAVLGNPVVAQGKKTNILDAIFAGKVNNATIGFFKLMVDKGRGEVLYTTATEYVKLYNAKMHITKAVVVSASPLSASNQDVIARELQNAIGGTIQLHAKVDPALIGGFVLTVGDRQLDTSVLSSLKKLKKDFAAQAVL
ncbi:ATP synthase F1 subunit delta [Mucilaginibacter pallidiroseus]|uniref:ATP synthase subunit delta n=1 Tax=Mucilaginibacter pallidiroseus TaxID=2599295 RepID=A0A563TX32_9SPHI|nr:ATP synthase F1 subunit delta [Mucilaginibacter pallidiroseus]TWR23866.1 ATP synthase F1 subunit delta [Mucilaginibacter pallidiroseus]